MNAKESGLSRRMTSSRAALATLASSLALAGAATFAVDAYQQRRRSAPTAFAVSVGQRRSRIWLQEHGSELGLKFLQLVLGKARIDCGNGTPGAPSRSPLSCWEGVEQQDWETALSDTTLLHFFRFVGAGTYNAVFSNASVALRIGVRRCREDRGTAGGWPSFLPEICTRDMTGPLRPAADRACVRRLLEAGMSARELAEGYLVFYQEGRSPKCMFVTPGLNFAPVPPEFVDGSVLILPIAVMEFCPGGTLSQWAKKQINTLRSFIRPLEGARRGHERSPVITPKDIQQTRDTYASRLESDGFIAACETMTRQVGVFHEKLTNFYNGCRYLDLKSNNLMLCRGQDSQVEVIKIVDLDDIVAGGHNLSEALRQPSLLYADKSVLYPFYLNDKPNRSLCDSLIEEALKPEPHRSSDESDS